MNLKTESATVQAMKLDLGKAHGNAKWLELSVEQRELLETWLLEDGLGYRQAWEKAVQEFGYGGSVSSVRRFSEWRSRERLLAGFMEAGSLIQEVAAAPTEVESLKQAALKLMGQVVLQGVAGAPENLKVWGPVMQLLQQEEVANRRWLKAEENELRREQLKLARDRFEWDVKRWAEGAEPALPLLDPKQAMYAEHKRVNDIRRRLFGNDLAEPGGPENDEEAEAQRLEAEAKAARQEEAEQERARAAAEAQELARLREAEKVKAAQAEVVTEAAPSGEVAATVDDEAKYPLAEKAGGGWERVRPGPKKGTEAGAVFDRGNKASDGAKRG